MANYVPNFAKTPEQLVVALVNNDNTFGFTEGQYEIKGLTALAEPNDKGNDTEVKIDLLTIPSEVEGDFWPFYYKRMPLSQVFSDVTAAGKNVFRQVDVELDENGFPVDLAVFRAEILRKYGFNVTEKDYTITLVSAGAGTGVLRVTAKAENLAYTGSFEMGVQDSLASRVAITALNGFSKDSIEEVVPEV